MNTKDKVLKALEENREEYVSGEALASLLDISRNGIWKAIQALKEEGYLIEGVTNKGYMLKQETDIISSSGIKKYLTKDKDLFRYGHEEYNFLVRDIPANWIDDSGMIAEDEYCLGFVETKSTNISKSNQLHVEKILGF